MKKMTLKNKTRYKIWKHMKNELNKKIEKVSVSVTYLDKLRYKIFKYLSKKLSKKNLIPDVSADLRRFKEYISKKFPKSKITVLQEEMVKLSEYMQKMDNKFSSLHEEILGQNVATLNSGNEFSSFSRGIQTTNKIIEQEISKIKDILILQTLFPNIIKNMLPRSC